MKEKNTQRMIMYKYMQRTDLPPYGISSSRAEENKARFVIQNPLG
jgi:hypothetical protein